MLLGKLPADSWEAVTLLRSLLFLRGDSNKAHRFLAGNLVKPCVERKHELRVAGGMLVLRKTGILFFSNQTNFVVLVAVLVIF